MVSGLLPSAVPYETTSSVSESCGQPQLLRVCELYEINKAVLQSNDPSFVGMPSFREFLEIIAKATEPSRKRWIVIHLLTESHITQRFVLRWPGIARGHHHQFSDRALLTTEKPKRLRHRFASDSELISFKQTYKFPIAALGAQVEETQIASDDFGPA